MKEIQLTKGKVALVDAEDFEKLSTLNWYATWTRPEEKGGKCYARAWVKGSTRKKRKSIYMHRFIMKPPRNKVVDHINGESLDCRKSNLRVITQMENTEHCRFRKRPDPAEEVWIPSDD